MKIVSIKENRKSPPEVCELKAMVKSSKGKFFSAEVINPKSDYFGESFYLTHKAEVNGIENWYRCLPECYIKGVDSLWFNENELEIEEEYYKRAS